MLTFNGLYLSNHHQNELLNVRILSNDIFIAKPYERQKNKTFFKKKKKYN